MEHRRGKRALTWAQKERRVAVIENILGAAAILAVIFGVCAIAEALCALAGVGAW